MSTTKTKRILAGLAGVAVGLALNGCAPHRDSDSNDLGDVQVVETTDRTVVERRVKLSDGRTVVCVTYKHGSGGAISCDWAGAE